MSDGHAAAGPLSGLRVLECGGIGPGPHAVGLLADMGAEVLRIERGGAGGLVDPSTHRGRALLDLDLKQPADRDRALDLAGQVDVLVEGFRPGVMERLGLGPEVVLNQNPRLIYARMTGWGQAGPRAASAGHDINYIAISGMLETMGDADRPPAPPLNFVGDYGGGSMFLATGILAALYERGRSGQGQVIDAAIVDGVATMLAVVANSGILDPGRRLVSGEAPFYRCYRCADGLDLAVGSIEPHFYRAFLDAIGASELALHQQVRARWAADAGRIAAILATRPRDAWLGQLEALDACVTPVLGFDEARRDAHISARGSYAEAGDGSLVAAPAPRFSRTPGAVRANEPAEALLARWTSKEASWPAS